MNKEMMKEIKKLINNGYEMKGVSYEPTLEECDYLYKSGITTTVKTYEQKGLYVTWLATKMDFIKE